MAKYRVTTTDGEVDEYELSHAPSVDRDKDGVLDCYNNYQLVARYSRDYWLKVVVVHD